MKLIKSLLGFILFCSLLLSVMNDFPFLKEEINEETIEFSQNNSEPIKDNSAKKDIDDVDDFLLISDFNFSMLFPVSFIHNEFYTNYFHFLTTISSPPPKF